MAVFNHSRIDEAQAIDREDPSSVMAFTYLLMDYMEHLRALPAELQLQQRPREEKSAKAFIRLIDTDTAWPIAKQYMLPSLQNFGAGTVGKNQYLKDMLTVLECRQQSPLTINREDQVQRWEADLLWRRLAAHIEFIAALSGDGSSTRQHELANTLDNLRKVFPLNNLAVLEKNELGTIVEDDTSTTDYGNALKKVDLQTQRAGIPTPPPTREGKKGNAMLQKPTPRLTGRNGGRTKSQPERKSGDRNPGSSTLQVDTTSRISKKPAKQGRISFKTVEDVAGDVGRSIER